MKQSKRVINEKLGAGHKMFAYSVQNGEIVTFPGTKQTARFIPNWSPMLSIDVPRQGAAQELRRNRLTAQGDTP